MIVTNLEGGLGNQMFQYATGMAVAKKLGVDLKCTIDLMASHRAIRSYELQKVFGISPIIASRKDLSSLISPWRSGPHARRFLSKPLARRLRGSKFVSDDHGVFISDLPERCSDGAYLHGYWQSQKYFSAYEDQVRSYFEFPSLEAELDQCIRDEVENRFSVGVHVRRGDYVVSSGAESIHSVLPQGYYRTAINNILRERPDARVFAFSDDPEWVEAYIKPLCGDVRVVDHNAGPNSYRDMHLLSLCDTIITANSSFSWWAAWLNNKPGKRIIAPRAWFTTERVSSADIVPVTWEVLE